MSIAFSVVVPAYNREDFIEETLASIFAQEHPPSEVIVVDDGSTDATAAKARAWPGCTVMTVANGGAASARHTGVLSARSDWVAFCDSDDLWRPDHLSRIADAIQLRPDAPFFFTNYNYLRGGIRDKTTKLDEAPEGFWDRFVQIGPNLRVAERSIFEERRTSTTRSAATMRRSGGYRARTSSSPCAACSSHRSARCSIPPPLFAGTKAITRRTRSSSSGARW